MTTPTNRAWDRLSRRAFMRAAGVGGLGLLAGCGRLPWQGEAPPKVARIGFLGTGSREGHAFVLGELLLGLRELGYIEGQTILIEYRFSEQGDDRLPALAAEIARTSPDVIVTDGTPAALAARESVETTPIVMVRNADPVGNGLVASLARPGGRITGLSSYGPQLSRKRLDILKETVPGLMRVGVLWDPASRSNPAIELQFRETQAAGAILGVQVLSLQVGDGGELQPAFHTAMQESVEALVVFGDPFSFSQRAQIVALAVQNGLPAMYANRQFVDAGGLMAYGAHAASQYRRAAYYVDRIIKGAKPADLPVEQPMTFEFVVNLKTAQALGITFPNEILLQVTEVVQ